jgi:hypothetical protein
MGLVSLAWAAVLGWLLLRALGLRSRPAAGIAGLLLEAGLGAGLGLGVTSCLYFVWLWSGIASRPLLLGVEVALAAAASFFAYRHRTRTGTDDSDGAPPRFRYAWLLALGFSIALLLFAYGFHVQYEANPQGHWDTWAIWNLRARFLFAGSDAWRGAVSPLIPLSHPEYPLLWPGAIARAWMIQGADTTYGPTAFASLLFALAVATVLAGSLAHLRRSPSLGWLAGILLLGTNGFVFQSSSFYADVPLSLYALSALAAALIAQSRDWDGKWLCLAGVFASLAAWTKNEGIVFLAAFVAVLIAAARAKSLAALAGAAPVALLVALFKLALAPADTIAKASAFQPSRFPAILGKFAKTVWSLGEFPAHPVLALAVCAFALRFAWKRDYAWAIAAPVLLLLGDFVVIASSPNDLTWLLDTTMNRLLIQVWPALLLCFFVFLRAPVSPEAATGKAPRARDERTDRSAAPPRRQRQPRAPGSGSPA